MRKYWPWGRDDGRGKATLSQRWAIFVRNHADAMVACDFAGFPPFEPTHKLIESPIPLAHDVVVQEVRNDVFDAHPAWQSVGAAAEEVTP
jgi:hypothetical protein